MKDIDPQKLAGLFYGAVAKSLPLVWLHCHPEWWEEVAIDARLDIGAITEDAGRAYSNWLVEIGAAQSDEAKQVIQQILSQPSIGGTEE